MPIVIMPNGEMVDSVTGNPVNTPANRVPGMENNMGQLIANRPSQMGQNMNMQQLDPGSIVREGEMPMAERLTVEQKKQILMDMGLTEGEAIDAIAMEESAGNIEPRRFGGNELPQGGTGMGALGGVPMGGQAPMAMPTPRPQMPNDMGADRTMNPMDRITSRNAPST